MTTLPYVYRITEIVRVVDGDTYWMRVDVGFRNSLLVDVRLNGWDTPETRHGSSYERSQGVVARGVSAAWLADRIARHGLWVRTEPDPDDFGRWLGTIWTEDGEGAREYLGEVLSAEGLASTWPTRWHEEHDRTGGKA